MQRGIGAENDIRINQRRQNPRYAVGLTKSQVEMSSLNCRNLSRIARARFETVERHPQQPMRGRFEIVHSLPGFQGAPHHLQIVFVHAIRLHPGQAVKDFERERRSARIRHRYLTH
ncbi:MAG: hypothetical protein BWY63_02732 [Chloroflexi bacterium ADurb.Bin360]|nr:MAG: hypothetical protein BWY63_02732 [Chloroflexi bacterium ADurb.Bin360]